MRTAWRARSRWCTSTAWLGSPPGGSASRTRGSGRSSAPEASLTLGGAGPEVGEVEGVHPVANLGEPLLALGIGLGQLTVLVRLGEDAGLVEHLVCHEDAGSDPHRHGDRV